MIQTSTHRATGSTKALVLGLLLAALLTMSMTLAATKPAHANTTFTVTSFRDTGDGVCNSACTLREAITLSNARFGADTIEFDIGGSGVRTIAPASALPVITDTVTIDGYTQPGSKKNTQKARTNAVLLVELSGTGGASGLIIDADNVVVRGLVINRFSETHIDVSGSNNRIEGNFIGPDATGTIDVGGGGDGAVNVNSGSGNVIGGALPGARNLISGNDRAGIFIIGSSLDDRTKDSRIEGNLIGTKKDGTSPLGNGAGVSFFRSSGNTVGGTTPGAANTIAFNEGEGVTMFGDESTGNRVLSNSIFSNGDLGIDLGSDGPTPNDPGDVDTGPNGLQNFPVLTSATTSSGGTTTITGKLKSAPNQTFKVRFLSNPPATEAEGKKFVGSASVTTDAGGRASISFEPANKVGVGQTVTATATDSGGNTSEFSAPKTVASR